MIGVGSGSNTYVWVGEEWLATWLAEERVVEAILGHSDADPSGTAAAAAADKKDGLQGSRSKADDHVSSYFGERDGEVKHQQFQSATPRGG